MNHAYRLCKTEPIPARESKLILAALAEVDWGHDQDTPLHPFRVVHEEWRLWRHSLIKPGTVLVNVPTLPGKTFAEQMAVLREWMQTHRDTYRIQRTALE